MEAAQEISSDEANGLDIWLTALIYVGLAVHFIYPFCDNPFSHLVSDSIRHFEHAVFSLNHDMYGMSDALGYQLWLSVASRIFGSSRLIVAAYAGLMSMATALIWIAWIRLCLPTKRMILLASIMLVWLPNWIKFYSYFMEETLLLLSVGTMLFFGWKAKQSLQLQDCLLFAIAAGLSFITKANCAPVIGITLVLLALALKKQLPEKTAFKYLAMILGIMVGIAALAPISFYSRSYSWCWFLPAQATSNKLYYESGAKQILIEARYFDRVDKFWKEEIYNFGCPSYYNDQLTPFSYWRSPRKGDYKCRINFENPPDKWFLPKVELSLQKRVALTLENWIYLFVGLSWPTEFPNCTVNFERWLWPVFTFAIVSAVIKKRRLNELDVLCLGTLLVLMFQQECVMEGRYRICWEGVVIPTFVLSVSDLLKRKTVKVCESNKSITIGTNV